MTYVRNAVNFLTGNLIVNCAIISWFAAQIFKVLINLVTTKKLTLSYLITSGSMPSSHASTVIATAYTVARVCGADSAEFGITMVFAMVVMYDAAGVRRAAGEQAKILNYIMDNWGRQTPEMFSKDLKELIGHTPLEVLAGAALGLVIGILMTL